MFNYHIPPDNLQEYSEATRLLNLAVAYDKSGDLLEAIDHYQQSREKFTNAINDGRNSRRSKEVAQNGILKIDSRIGEIMLSIKNDPVNEDLFANINEGRRKVSDALNLERVGKIENAKTLYQQAKTHFNIVLQKNHSLPSFRKTSQSFMSIIDERIDKISANERFLSLSNIHFNEGNNKLSSAIAKENEGYYRDAQVLYRQAKSSFELALRQKDITPQMSQTCYNFIFLIENRKMCEAMAYALPVPA